MVELAHTHVQAPAPLGRRRGPAHSVPDMNEDFVVVYAVPLAVPENEFEVCRGALSADELRRAGRFHHEHDRRRWVVARGTLRIILGHHLGARPEALAFSAGPHGKPGLAGDHSHSGLEFNLSHSDDLALVALSNRSPVGIDVEKVRSLDDFDDLVSRFFSRRETALFLALPDLEKPAAFFNLWTRKEAWLKATGEGIGRFLHLVEVSFLPGEPAKLLSIPRHLRSGGGWKLAALEPWRGYAAALAVRSVELRMKFEVWTHDV